MLVLLHAASAGAVLHNGDAKQKTIQKTIMIKLQNHFIDIQYQLQERFKLLRIAKDNSGYFGNF